MPFIEAEITAEDVADAMNAEGVFLVEMLRTIAERVDMGMLRDNVSDVAGQMSKSDATYIHSQFASLAETIKDGFNMANVVEQIK